MNEKINWGVLGTAYIATEFVIPAMMKSKYCDVLAIASRDNEKANSIANQFNIPKSYGSYEELLKDEEIKALYIPLPNNLHVPWSLMALQANKHVLVEKPIGLTSLEAKSLLQESEKNTHLKIMEAFMYKFHPQWLKVKELIKNNLIGDVKSIQSSFSFFDNNPKSIVNNKDLGGGSLMDIGCYPVSLSRYLFNSEPLSVFAKIEYHAEFGTDILTSAVMEFSSGHSSFFCSTLLEETQKVEIFGSKGKITLPVPFNPANKMPSKIIVQENNIERDIIIDICDQYSIQADHFSHCILKDVDPKINLIDSVNNMIVIENIFESNKTGKVVLI